MNSRGKQLSPPIVNLILSVCGIKFFTVINFEKCRRMSRTRSSTESAVGTGSFSVSDPQKKKKKPGKSKSAANEVPPLTKYSASSQDIGLETADKHEELMTPRTRSSKFAKLFGRKTTSGSDLLANSEKEKKKKKKSKKGQEEQGEEVERSIPTEVIVEEKDSEDEKEEQQEEVREPEERKLFKKRRASTATVNSVSKKEQKRTQSQSNFKINTGELTKKKERIGSQIKGELQSLLSPRRGSSTNLTPATPSTPTPDPTAPPEPTETPKELPEKKEDPSEEKKKLRGKIFPLPFYFHKKIFKKK